MPKNYLPIQSFYSRSLSRTYVLNGQGLGLLSLFFIATVGAVIFAVKMATFAMLVTPEQVQTFTATIPDIKIVDGKITEPQNFFQRIQLSDGVNLTLDTTDNTTVTQSSSPGEIYISKNAIHFINGNRIELFPLKQFMKTNSVTLTQENIHTFVNTLLKETYFVLPFCVLIITLPLLFMKFFVLTYGMALLTYLITLYPSTPLDFEQRMRLAVISCLPVFVINLFFGTLLSWFTLGVFGSIVVALVYLYFHLLQLPKGFTFIE